MEIKTKSLKYTVITTPAAVSLPLRYELIVYSDKYSNQGTEYTDKYNRPASF